MQIYQVTAQGGFSRDYALRDQIRRSCVSIMANVAEGCGRWSDREFGNFLNIAHGSTAETQSHLYVALDQGYIDEPTFAKLYGLLEEVSKMTMSLVRHLHADR